MADVEPDGDSSSGRSWGPWIDLDQRHGSPDPLGLVSEDGGCSSQDLALGLEDLDPPAELDEPVRESGVGPHEPLASDTV